jgi:DNA-binding MarR family transcriptional regulator
MVHLTKNGEKVLNEVAPILLQVIMTMQEGVSEEDQKTVIGVMKKIQKNIGNQIDSCSNNK